MYVLNLLGLLGGTTSSSMQRGPGQPRHRGLCAGTAGGTGRAARLLPSGQRSFMARLLPARRARPGASRSRRARAGRRHGREPDGSSAACAALPPGDSGAHRQSGRLRPVTGTWGFALRSPAPCVTAGEHVRRRAGAKACGRPPPPGHKGLSPSLRQRGGSGAAAQPGSPGRGSRCCRPPRAAPNPAHTPYLPPGSPGGLCPRGPRPLPLIGRQ